MKNLALVAVVVPSFLFVPLSTTCIWARDTATLNRLNFDECKERILKSADIYDEGHYLEKQGRYDVALRKYQEAVDEAYRPVNRDCGSYDSSDMARGGIMRTHEKQGNFELALQDLQWFLNINPSKDFYIDTERTLQALVRARDSKSSQPVYDHIQYLKEKYKEVLPPRQYHATGLSPTVATSILRLYDHVGDHDSGISFIDSIVHYFYSKNLFLKKVATSQEALKKEEERGKHWRTYKAIYEYLLVREAFEQDKAEGTKGRATKALIQSDYFPW